MIKSEKDYKDYLIADARALRVKPNIINFLYNDIYRFQVVLRFLEYKINCKENRIIIIFIKLYYNSLSKKLGFTIPPNVFGPGLSIAHYGTIVVNGAAKVGKNCRLNACTNIGTAAGYSNAAPEIGDNCYIGPGAKIFGPIKLLDNIAIGANAVVNKSMNESNITIGGVPARKISSKSSVNLI